MEIGQRFGSRVVISEMFHIEWQFGWYVEVRRGETMKGAMFLSAFYTSG